MPATAAVMTPDSVEAMPADRPPVTNDTSTAVAAVARKTAAYHIAAELSRFWPLETSVNAKQARQLSKDKVISEIRQARLNIGHTVLRRLEELQEQINDLEQVDTPEAQDRVRQTLRKSAAYSAKAGKTLLATNEAIRKILATSSLRAPKAERHRRFLEFLEESKGLGAEFQELRRLTVKEYKEMYGSRGPEHLLKVKNEDVFGLAVRTTPVTLTTKVVGVAEPISHEFGEYWIVFDLRRANDLISEHGSVIHGYDTLFTAFPVVKKPHPVRGGTTTHPHVQAGKICLGEGCHALRKALSERRLFDAFTIVDSILKTYNPSSPFTRLEIWAVPACPSCAQHTVGARKACSTRGCDRVAVCSRCVSVCRRCDQTVCGVHVATCECCGVHICAETACRLMNVCSGQPSRSGGPIPRMNYICSACAVACPTCSQNVYRRLIIDNRCPRCPALPAEESVAAPATETAAAAAPAETGSRPRRGRRAAAAAAAAAWAAAAEVENGVFGAPVRESVRRRRGADGNFATIGPGETDGEILT